MVQCKQKESGILSGSPSLLLKKDRTRKPEIWNFQMLFHIERTKVAAVLAHKFENYHSIILFLIYPK